jgi:diketogulonate reductase-like aldo/keto reductase
MEYVTVQDEEVPALGLGTYQLRGKTCVETVRDALEIGYRHIDTAEYYDNQREVGEAIADASVDRDEVFLTTKVWRSNLQHDQVLRSARESLDKLGLEYVDLLLIHWPSRTVPVAETLDAMTKLHDDGNVRHIGVSNFSVGQLQEAIAVSDVPIFTDQVEYHPFNGQADLVDFCIESGVMLTAYSPLGKGTVVGDETLATIGDRYGKSAAQVALRWLVQQDTVAAIPKASSREHLRENIDIFDFELTDEEMNSVFELHGGLIVTLRRQLGL